jgi:hypothetical protein
LLLEWRGKARRPEEEEGRRPEGKEARRQGGKEARRRRGEKAMRIGGHEGRTPAGTGQGGKEARRPADGALKTYAVVLKAYAEKQEFKEAKKPES